MLVERQRDLAELEDFRSARLAHLLTCAFFEGEPELADFLLLSPREKKTTQQTPEHMLNLITAFNDIYGGTVIVNG